METTVWRGSPERGGAVDFRTNLLFSLESSQIYHTIDDRIDALIHVFKNNRLVMGSDPVVH
jgi:hypothetical protein